MYQYNKLRGRIYEKYRTQDAYAKKLGITKQALSLKMCGKTGFDQRDIERWAELLNIDKEEIGEYFFT